MNRLKSEMLYKEAKKYLPAGVNSPVRSYAGLDFAPPFIEKANGAYLWDIDGNRYIDYVASWGPAILGHAHPEVVAIVKEAAERGLTFGAPTEAEVKLALLVKDAFPSMAMMRFVNSGTEATMSAIRLARGFTKRDKIIKFNGCYHGHADHLLVKAGSGVATFNSRVGHAVGRSDAGSPSSKGVPVDFAKHTLVAEYNNLEMVQEMAERYADKLAAIIVEPVAGNMGVVLPEPGFLEGLREICTKTGALLIFDEVITGFRVSFGGAQERFGVIPDITCLGKILGGGLPVGAYGGRKDIMENVSPLGGVYQAGTLSGNPLAMTAGLVTLTLLRFARSEAGREVFSRHSEAGAEESGVYTFLEFLTCRLTDGLSKVLKKKGIPHTINRMGSMFTVFFTERRVRNYSDAASADRKIFDRYFVHMLNNGIYLAPSPFEAAFVSFAHTEDDIERTLEILDSSTFIKK